MIVQIKTLIMKQLLARKNISYNAFARRAKISSPYFSQVMRQVRNPSPIVRAKILRALNASQKIQGQPEFKFDDLFVIKGR